MQRALFYLSEYREWFTSAVSLQAHSDHVGDKDGRGESPGLDPSVPGEEDAVAASEAAAVPAGLNKVSAPLINAHSFSHNHTHTFAHMTDFSQP